MRLLERVLDPRVHLTLAFVRLGSGDEVSRVRSSDPREQLMRTAQHTRLGPARHVRVTLLVCEHVRSDAIIGPQVQPAG